MLIRFLVYVLQTVDMDFARREELLARLDNQVITRARFFGGSDSVDLLFQFVKGGVGSKLCHKVLLDRVSSCLAELSRERKIVLANLLPSMKDRAKEKTDLAAKLQEAVGASEQIMQSRQKLDHEVCLEALFNFARDGMAVRPFVEYSLERLVHSVYLLTFEQLCRLAWLALNTADNKQLLSKILERLQQVDLQQEALVKLNFKDFSYLIWTLSAAPDKQQVRFVFDAYEDLIQAKSRLTAKAISQVLWAVTLKHRLKKPTHEKLMQSLSAVLEGLYQLTSQQLAGQTPAAQFRSFSEASAKEQTQAGLEELGTWEVMTLIWGVSRFDSPDTSLAVQLLAPVFLGKLDQFTCTELLMVFRVFAEQDYLAHPGHALADTAQIHSSFYDALISQLAALSPGLRIDEISIAMFYLLKSPQLQYRDHSDSLKRLFEVLEEKKKKIEVASPGAAHN